MCADTIATLPRGVAIVFPGIEESIMPIREIAAQNAGQPAFEVPESDVHSDARVFSLSSHTRARDALDFGLRARDPGSIYLLWERIAAVA